MAPYFVDYFLLLLLFFSLSAQWETAQIIAVGMVHVIKPKYVHAPLGISGPIVLNGHAQWANRGLTTQLQQMLPMLMAQNAQIWGPVIVQLAFVRVMLDFQVPPVIEWIVPKMKPESWSALDTVVV